MPFTGRCAAVPAHQGICPALPAGGEDDVRNTQHFVYIEERFDVLDKLRKRGVLASQSAAREGNVVKE